MRAPESRGMDIRELVHNTVDAQFWNQRPHTGHGHGGGPFRPLYAYDERPQRAQKEGGKVVRRGVAWRAR